MRVPDWEKRLLATVEEWRSRPFEWGGADCLAFAQACAAACQGSEVGPVLPCYGDEKAARRVLRGFGGNLGEALAGVLPEIPVSMAQRGDWGLVETGKIGAVVICLGKHFVARDLIGQRLVPRHDVVRAFRV